MTETLEASLPDHLDWTAERAMRRLCDLELTVATAESCTGGMLASLLTDIIGCAHGFDRGFVTYTGEAKTELLGLEPALVDRNDAVNAGVARAMAEGALRHSRADIALSVTGFAGPAKSCEEGLVFCGCAARGQETIVVERHFGSIGRGPIRIAALEVLLELFEQAIEREDRSRRENDDVPSQQLIFYTNPMSRGQIVRWMLEELGVPYETRILDYGSTMKEPDYLLVNPMGKVPAIRHGDRVVTETAAICAYLAEAFPDAGLGPRPEERADYYRWIFFAAGPVEQAVTNKAFGLSPTREQQRMAGYGNFDLVIDVLDGWLGQRNYVCGGRFTAADVVVGSQLMWGMEFGTIPRRPAFEEYAARLSARESYQRARGIDSQLIAAMQADLPSEG